MSLLDALLQITADEFVSKNNEYVEEQAFFRLNNPGWYQKSDRFYIYDFDSGNAGSSRASGAIQFF